MKKLTRKSPAKPHRVEKTLAFTKMHGLGNDFIVIDQRERSGRSFGQGSSHKSVTPELARKLCDRRFGIGADQVLIIKSPLLSPAQIESGKLKSGKLKPAKLKSAKTMSAKKQAQKPVQMSAMNNISHNPVDHAHVRMEIFNSDGSVAEMCGNGIRAVALYLFTEKTQALGT